MTHPEHIAEAISSTLAYARARYAQAVEQRDRDFYAGMIDHCAGTFDTARCRFWQVPRDELSYCEGGEEALIRLHQVIGTTPGRMRHGDIVGLPHGLD